MLNSAHVRGRRAGALLCVVVLAATTACTAAATESVPAAGSSGAAAPATPNGGKEPVSEPDPMPDPVPDQQPTVPTFDRTLLSIDDPASLWVVSNKLRPLQPNDWVPADLELPVGVVNTNGQPLRAPAARAIEALVQHAATAGLHLGVVSAYRPYDYQAMLYQGYVARDGQAAADTYSARPGHSEHQTGLAVDVDDFTGCTLQACFGETEAGQWVAAHAADHGFVVRYPLGSEHITGFTYEPWHLRYVGVELATELRATGTATLEQFFGLPEAPGYAAQ